VDMVIVEAEKDAMRLGAKEGWRGRGREDVSERGEMRSGGGKQGWVAKRRGRRGGGRGVKEKGDGDDKGGGVVEKETCVGAVGEGAKREMIRWVGGGVETVM